MRNLYRKTKHLYELLKDTPCPVFSNETIYFYQSGFKHLIRKGRKFRSGKDILRRTHLLQYVSDIIISSTDIKNIREEDGATFWELGKDTDDGYVAIIIRQLTGGQKHFFSIMNKR